MPWIPVTKIFAAFNNKMAVPIAMGDQFFNPGGDFSFSVILYGRKHSLDKVPLNPAIEGSISILMRTP
jgi:hypothetical protein